MVALAHLLVENELPSVSLGFPSARGNARTFLKLVLTVLYHGRRPRRRSVLGATADALLLAVVLVASGGRHNGAVILPRTTLATPNVWWRQLRGNGSWRAQRSTRCNSRGVCNGPVRSSRWFLWRGGWFPSTWGVSRGKPAPQVPRITASGGAAAKNDVTAAAAAAPMEEELERRLEGGPREREGSRRRR